MSTTSNGAAPDNCAPSGTAEDDQRHARGPRRGDRAGVKQSAAVSASPAAVSTTPGAPSRFEQRDQREAADGGAEEIRARRET